MDTTEVINHVKKMSCKYVAHDYRYMGMTTTEAKVNPATREVTRGRFAEIYECRRCGKQFKHRL